MYYLHTHRVQQKTKAGSFILIGSETISPLSLKEKNTEAINSVKVEQLGTENIQNEKRGDFSRLFNCNPR